MRKGIVSEGERLDMEWLSKAIESLQERSRTLIELANSLRYYLLDYVEIDQEAKKKFLSRDMDRLAELKERLSGLALFTAAEIEKVFISMAEKHNIKLGDIAQPARVAITGNTVSPGIFEVMEIVGHEKALKRLSKVVEEA